jgi:hypothetical protein
MDELLQGLMLPDIQGRENPDEKVPLGTDKTAPHFRGEVLETGGSGVEVIPDEVPLVLEVPEKALLKSRHPDH